MSDAPENAWRCSVCGYVHRGVEPPEWCPVCGSPSSEYEAYTEPPVTPKATVHRERCLNCSYMHMGSEPPEICPICASSADCFEPVDERDEIVEAGGRVAKVVVVGAGIAGVSAVESLRRAAPNADITLISKEHHLPYYRLNLTRYLAGEIGEHDLPIHPQSWYDEEKIELLSGMEIDNLSLKDREVELLDGSKVAYEKLILTIGAHPFIPPFPGAHMEGVNSLRTVEDAKSILEASQSGKTCVCIGGGLLGIETAGALARNGTDVTLLEGHEWLMPRQLNRKAAELLAEHVAATGIKLQTEARTKEIVGDERVAGVLLEDGNTIPAEVVIIATGIRPNSYLARRAGLNVNKGVIVDNLLTTSHPDVFAAGDVAEHRGQLYGTWAPSQYQGSIAGMNAAGGAVEFGGIPRSNALKVLSLELVSIGQFEPEDGSYSVIEDHADGRYIRFVFWDSHLVGGILLGDASLSGAIKKAVEGDTDFSGLLRNRPKATEVCEYLAERVDTKISGR